MAVSSLIVHFSRRSDVAAADARAALAGCDALTLGPRVGHRQAAVLETGGPGEDRQWLDWINEIPGIAFVDVVLVHLDPQDASERVGAAAAQRRAAVRTGGMSHGS